MEVIYGLIPAMIILGLIMVGILVWAVKSGQYDDLEGDANRILMDDDDPLLPENSNDKNTKKNSTERIKQAGRNWPDAD
ncbi:Type cbb3 cytochrome oxidase biogenesis protein CcoS, involved in heme b insertion [hydrothermal vent metagenome]|uniref:Type cbb3 cytochrome oxidase biogenesis protein CcoS, involved in heme b insertion n=1 Tax=hydrothermal vent metagenome TaxID=652676 RepID=A0A3B1A8D5_9ZZZZ